MAESEDHVNEETPEEAVEAEAPEADAPAAAPATEAEAAAEPAEELSFKERRRHTRQRQSTEAGPARTPEERAAERAERRRKNARSRTAWRASARQRAAKRSAAAESAAPVAPAADEESHGRRKLRQGIVVGDGADKTITVRIDTARRHRRYSKIVRTSQTLHAHDETNDANIGDTVTVREARPLSRNKRWRLIEVLERAK